MVIALPDAAGNSRSGISRLIMGVFSFQEAVSARKSLEKSCLRTTIAGYGRLSAELPSSVSQYRFKLFAKSLKLDSGCFDCPWQAAGCSFASGQRSLPGKANLPCPIR
jgi:hypothetical protein